jgi:hypothetical protein
MDPADVTPNAFQRRVEERLQAALNELALPIEARRVGLEAMPAHSHQPPEAVVHIRARDLEVRIREDSVSFEISGKGDYYEMPDYQTADALADAFLGSVKERLRMVPKDSTRPGRV